MDKNLTEMILVVDRSSSMYTRASEASLGINQLIKEQKEKVGNVNFTLIEFNNECIDTHYRVPIDNIKEYKMNPIGSTALLDAVGETIDKIGNSLNDTPEASKPGLVVFCIVTDGEENSSKKYSLNKIKEMIKHQEEKYNWQFTYLGANQNAFQVASDIGINKNGTANFINFRNAYMSTSEKFLRMRSQVLNNQNVDNSYTKEELVNMIS